MRRLGIDHGDKRVGVALSDEDGRFAQPRDTLDRKDHGALIAAVTKIARDEGVAEIVVGLPLTLEGRETASARRARRFAEKLEEACELPIVLWDERLSTAAAERSLREAGVKAKGQRAVVDKVAAALILQSYLDARASAEERGRPWPDGAGSGGSHDR